MSDNKKGPVLVVMAAGMGSRFGGLKQIADVDGRGHALIDYAVYDAVVAGFGYLRAFLFLRTERSLGELRMLYGAAVKCSREEISLL